MKSLTVAYVTSRQEPHFEWFADGLESQGFKGTVIVVDAQNERRPIIVPRRESFRVQIVLPKPTIWQGPHRLTKEDWWAIANARNTAFCLCRTEWIACCDDRSILEPGWLNHVKAAMHHGYAVCGAYEKVQNAVVQNGLLRSYDATDGKDCRIGTMNGAVPCPGEWFFGANFALPLEWALAVNGCDETCDSSGMEDVIFGMMLKNAGYPVCYDLAMKLWEDRTPGKIGPDMVRKDKGVSPNDKSHALLAMLRDLKRASHPIDLRKIRDDALAGKPWPVPTGPDRDWYDGQPLSKM